MSKGHQVKRVKQYIKADRPRRLQTFVRKHRLQLSNIALKKERNLLHYCCKHGSSGILRYLLDEGVLASHRDSDQNLPLHTALLRALAYEESSYHDNATKCYTELVLPLLQTFPGLLEARNAAGTSCRELLDRFVQYRDTEQTQVGGAPKRRHGDGDEEEDASERAWRDKLADEFQHEYTSEWGAYEQDYTEPYDSTETFDDWADRLRQEYYTRQQARSRPTSHERHHKKTKTSPEKPKTQAGPENLEEIRAKMRLKFDAREKEDEGLRILKRRIKYESRYKEILDSKEVVAYEAVPWPSVKSPSEDMVILFEGISTDSVEYKRYLRDQRVRWHPDKFLQRFATRLLASDKDRILERVTDLSQKLNKLSVS